MENIGEWCAGILMARNKDKVALISVLPTLPNELWSNSHLPLTELKKKEVMMNGR